MATKLVSSSYSMALGKNGRATKLFVAKGRGDAFLSLINKAAVTLQQATDLLDACDEHGKAACFNVRGETVQVKKE